MRYLSKILPFLLWLPILLPANSPEELRLNYQRMQSAYQRQIQELEQQLAREETALLNRFLISLVRLEQQQREEGNLDGVLQARTLRDSLLETPGFPEADISQIDALQRSIQQLLDDRQGLITQSHTSLENVNRDFSRQIEPVMRDLTRAGDFDAAREILNVRRVILATLGETETAPALPAGNLHASTDPNVLAFSLEPAGTTRMPGFTPRRTQIPYTPETTGNVRANPKSFSFRNSRLHVPESAMTALVFQVKQNQMLTLELGFQTPHASQRSAPEHLPTAIFYFGRSPLESNLALTHEGSELVLYLRTNRLPESAPHHRVSLGRVSGGRMEHLAVTYRSGELTIYRDGSETRKIRAVIGGGFENWQAYPLTLGGSPGSVPDVPDPSWTGEVVFLYLRSSHETSRGISAAYSRFADFVTRPLPAP